MKGIVVVIVEHVVGCSGKHTGLELGVFPAAGPTGAHAQVHIVVVAFDRFAYGLHGQRVCFAQNSLGCTPAAPSSYRRHISEVPDASCQPSASHRCYRPSCVAATCKKVRILLMGGGAMTLVRRNPPCFRDDTSSLCRRCRIWPQLSALVDAYFKCGCPGCPQV